MNLQEKRAMLARKECERTDAEFGIRIAEIEKEIRRLNRWIDYPMKKFVQDVRETLRYVAEITLR